MCTIDKFRYYLNYSCNKLSTQDIETCKVKINFNR